MSITIEVNGDQYENFLSASVNIRLDALTNTFAFTTTSQKKNPLPFLGGEPCKIFVDGEVVLTGFIEVVTVNYDTESHTIAVMGRDKTGDLLDSTLDKVQDITSTVTLKQLIEKVLTSSKLSNIKVVQADGLLIEPFNPAEDKMNPEPGKSIFDFIEKYARKRQVLLTSNGDADIVITQSSGVVIPDTIQNIISSDQNNVLVSSVSYDTTGRFNTYKFVSSLSPIAANIAGVLDLESLVSQSGGTTDPEIRASRQMILIAETSSSDGQNNKRSQWEANIRKARGRVYSAKVKGFRNTSGDLWQINNLVSVVDDFCGINSQMLINTVSFNVDLNGGNTTTMSLLNKNAYTLSIAEPKNNEVGLGLFG